MWPLQGLKRLPGPLFRRWKPIPRAKNSHDRPLFLRWWWFPWAVQRVMVAWRTPGRHMNTAGPVRVLRTFAAGGWSPPLLLRWCAGAHTPENPCRYDGVLQRPGGGEMVCSALPWYFNPSTTRQHPRARPPPTNDTPTTQKFTPRSRLTNGVPPPTPRALDKPRARGYNIPERR